MLTVSLLLHLACFTAGSGMFVPKPAPPQVRTSDWVVDLSTMLVVEERGESKTAPSPALPAVPESSPAPARPAATPEPAASPKVPATATTEAPQALPAADTPLIVTKAPMDSRTQGKGVPPRFEAFANTMNMQMLMGQLKQFFRMTNLSVRVMVEQSLPAAELKAMEGSRGTVTVAYRDGSVVDSLAIDTDNAALRTLLKEKIRWSDVPAPKKYLLPYGKVTFSISFSNEKINVSVSPA